MLVEADPFGDEVEAGEEPPADGRQATGEAPGRTGAGNVGEVELREALAQDQHLLGRRSFLRREDVRRVE